MLVGFDFAPVGFALCQGQLLSISQNTALFSLIGTYYGGDGKSTFALPNLQGALAVSQGQGPGLNMYDIGEPGGSTTVTLTTSTVPAHQHQVLGAKGEGTVTTPSGKSLAQQTNTQVKVYAPAGQNSAMNAQALGGAVGNGQPHNNMMPYLGLNWIIALRGIFPARN
jgi:microcystin-dependent protein